MKMIGSTLTVGIAGGSGSGKTTLTRFLAERFEGQVSVLNHDDYYKAHDNMTFEERKSLNYDEPDAFDNDLFIEQLAALKAGNDIECPIYDYSDHNRSHETKTIPHNPLILVDGFLIFADRRICDMMDARVFVDTDADIRFIRRLNRDVKERGRSLESVINQYRDTVKPMHEKYVQPSMREADIIVPEGGKNAIASEMIAAFIEGRLAVLKR